VMRCNVVCYEEDTPVLVIYEFLCRVSIHGVFIVRQGRPVGMISRTSLMRWFTSLQGFDTGTGIEGSDSISEVRPAAVAARKDLSVIAHAIMTEAESLEQCHGRPIQEIETIVTGGVSRIESLIHDLLSYSRDTLTEPASFQVSPAPSADNAAGVNGLLASGSFPEA